ncbi:hypothetical protein GF369_04255 [Candidatus Peregrinibacteria bacterium]|nr:hypothetical protein [Candidatus Peregrinibacteria bacterium]
MSSAKAGVIRGTVVHGVKKGRNLGYPTINISLEEGHNCLSQGVYICRILVRDEWHNALMHYGVKSMGTSDSQKKFCEVHVFDFHDDTYGESVTVNLLKKIRDVRQFDCEEDLIRQIDRDINTAHNYLSDHA